MIRNEDVNEHNSSDSSDQAEINDHDVNNVHLPVENHLLEDVLINNGNINVDYNVSTDEDNDDENDDDNQSISDNETSDVDEDSNPEMYLYHSLRAWAMRNIF